MINEEISEGYVFASFGNIDFVKFAVVSATRIRAYDKKRKIALVCCLSHKHYLNSNNLQNIFDRIIIIEDEHKSIVGFKHNIYKYMPFDCNMYIDSDMLICKNPDKLWHNLKVYGFTTTGQKSADMYFGSHKNAYILFDIIFGKRKKTLKKFNLSHLYRVQTGIIFASEYNITKKVCEFAKYYYSKKNQTHFISRDNENGRVLDTCEWSLGLAMSALKLHVYPWFNGYESPQLDFIYGLTETDKDYTKVSVKYYCNSFMHSLRGLNSEYIRKFIKTMLGLVPGLNDHMWVTPYFLHFGWSHQKKYFYNYMERKLNEIINSKKLYRNDFHEKGSQKKVFVSNSSKKK